MLGRAERHPRNMKQVLHSMFNNILEQQKAELIEQQRSMPEPANNPLLKDYEDLANEWYLKGKRLTEAQQHVEAMECYRKSDFYRNKHKLALGLIENPF